MSTFDSDHLPGRRKTSFAQLLYSITMSCRASITSGPAFQPTGPSCASSGLSPGPLACWTGLTAPVEVLPNHGSRLDAVVLRSWALAAVLRVIRAGRVAFFFCGRLRRAVPLCLVGERFPSAIPVRPPVGHASSPVKKRKWGVSRRVSRRVSCRIWLRGWFLGWLRVDDGSVHLRGLRSGGCRHNDRRPIVVGMRTFAARCSIVRLHLLAVRLLTALLRQPRRESGSKRRRRSLLYSPSSSRTAVRPAA